jgi:hypothetical protein
MVLLNSYSYSKNSMLRSLPLQQLDKTLTPCGEYFRKRYVRARIVFWSVTGILLVLVKFFPDEHLLLLVFGVFWLLTILIAPLWLFLTPCPQCSKAMGVVVWTVVCALAAGDLDG